MIKCHFVLTVILLFIYFVFNYILLFKFRFVIILFCCIFFLFYFPIPFLFYFIPFYFILTAIFYFVETKAHYQGPSPNHPKSKAHFLVRFQPNSRTKYGLDQTTYARPNLGPTAKPNGRPHLAQTIAWLCPLPCMIGFLPIKHPTTPRKPRLPLLQHSCCGAPPTCLTNPCV